MTTETQTEKEDRGDDFIPDETAPVEIPPPSPESATPESESATPKSEADEKFVPHHRFEELNQRLRLERESRLDMESRLNSLLQQEEAKKTPPFDAEAAEKNYLKAVLDGDTDQAVTLMRAIRHHERQQLEAEMTARTHREIEQATARTALETVAESAVQQYPFLDPNHASANPDAIAEVVEWRDYYLVAKRMTPAQALKQAVQRIAPGYAKGDTSPQGIAGNIPDRTLSQRQANAKAASQQPPPLGGVGARAQRQATADIEKMSEADFAALPAAEKARLRGDTVA